MELARSGKALLIAVAPAAGVAALFYGLAGGPIPAESVIDWFGTPITKLLNLLAHRLPAGGRELDLFLSSTGFVGAAFVNYWLLFWSLIGGTDRGRSVVDRAWPGFPAFLDRRLVRPGAGDIDAFNAAAPFFGRRSERSTLLDFARGAEPGLLWGGVSGRMGMGKTRLCLEAMKDLRREGWDVGLLPHDTADEIISAHRFRRNTLILIDDYEKAGSRAWAWLLAASASASGKKLRLLLVDQVSPIIPAALDQHERATLQGTSAISLVLGPLDAEAAGQLAQDHDGGGEARPLMLKLGGNPRAELRRRAAQRLDLARSLLGSDGPRLLAAAALAGPLPGSLVREVAPGAGSLRALGRLFEGEGKKTLRSAIPSVEPELLGHELLLQWADDESIAELTRLAPLIATYPERSLRTLLSIARHDWLPEGSALAETSSEHAAVTDALLGVAPQTWKSAAVARARAFVDRRHEQGNIMERYQDSSFLLARWPDLPEMRAAHANCLAGLVHLNADREAQGAGDKVAPDWTQARRFLRELAALIDRSPENLQEEGIACRCVAAHWVEADTKRASPTGPTSDIAMLREVLDHVRARLDDPGRCAGYLEDAVSVCFSVADACGSVALIDSGRPRELQPWPVMGEMLRCAATLSTIPALTAASARKLGMAYANIVGSCLAQPLDDPRSLAPASSSIEAALAGIAALEASFPQEAGIAEASLDDHDLFLSEVRALSHSLACSFAFRRAALDPPSPLDQPERLAKRIGVILPKARPAAEASVYAARAYAEMLFSAFRADRREDQRRWRYRIARLLARLDAMERHGSHFALFGPALARAYILVVATRDGEFCLEPNVLPVVVSTLQSLAPLLAASWSDAQFVGQVANTLGNLAIIAGRLPNLEMNDTRPPANLGILDTCLEALGRLGLAHPEVELARTNSWQIALLTEGKLRGHKPGEDLHDKSLALLKIFGKAFRRDVRFQEALEMHLSHLSYVSQLRAEREAATREREWELIARKYL